MLLVLLAIWVGYKDQSKNILQERKNLQYSLKLPLLKKPPGRKTEAKMVRIPHQDFSLATIVLEDV